MKQKMGRLIRYILIINRLSGFQKFVPGDELILALLSRSKSLKVIKPESLKHEIQSIYEKALERNK